ncbi:MAG TPA: helix-turn-helix transcriptional regulator [Candidatus Limnocylindria bacterium]
MPTKERLSAIGTARGRWMVRLFADEFKNARLAAGLSQARVAASVGLSQRTVSRYEAADPPYPDLVTAARLAAVVGLELKLHCFPGQVRLRDAAHVALVGRFLARLPKAVVRQLEAPIARGDQRAWDVLLTMGDTRIGLIAETRIRDLQALLRREHRKQVDGGVDVLILLLADTRNNRRAMAEAATLLGEEFPLRTRAVMAGLGCADAPAANGIVVL